MINKFLKYFTWIARACFVVMIVFSAIVGNSKPMTDSTTGLLLTFVPTVFKRFVGINIPIRLEAFYILFIYMANFLGSSVGFYDLIPSWDMILHTASGSFLAAISLSFINVAVKGKSIRDWNPWVLSLMVLTFAMACGTLWEFFEFGMDTFFNYGMQKHTFLIDGTIDTGLIDTMHDELCACAAALVFSISVFIYAMKGKYDTLEQFLIKKIKK